MSALRRQRELGGGALLQAASAPPPRPRTAPAVTRAVSRERLRDLREDVRARAENRPGVYRLMGAGESLLYVGKSVRVRSRLLSYFRAPRGEKAQRVIEHARTVDWDYVPSEFAALLAEMRSIRARRPPYNVEHGRRQTICFVQLTREAAPRLSLATDAPAGRGPSWGPVRGRGRALQALRALADLTGLRDCPASTPLRFADQLELFAHRGEPLCWRGEMRRCAAPCAGACTADAYADRLRSAARFLDGEDDAPLEALRERMAASAARLEYEHAAYVRDRLEHLAWLQQSLVRIRRELDALTLVYRVPGWQGDDRVYLLRRGRILEERAAPASAPENRDLIDRVRELFGEDGHEDASEDAARQTLRPGDVAEMLLVARWFRLRPDERANARHPAELLRRATDRGSAARTRRLRA